MAMNNIKSPFYSFFDVSSPFVFYILVYVIACPVFRGSSALRWSMYPALVINSVDKQTVLTPHQHSTAVSLERRNFFGFDFATLN